MACKTVAFQHYSFSSDDERTENEMKSQLILLLFASAFAATTAELVVGQYYAIRNVADGTYMYVSSEGISCVEVGNVGTIEGVNTTDVRYLWKYNVDAAGFVNLLVDQESLLIRYRFNVVSVHSGIWCIPDPRKEYILTEKGNSTYTIVLNLATNCFASLGPGQRLGYTSCDLDELNQQWEFIPV